MMTILLQVGGDSSNSNQGWCIGTVAFQAFKEVGLW